MNETIFMEWISKGNVTIPSMLLTYYRKLGITHEEFILILQLKNEIDKGNSFPDLTNIGEAMQLPTEQVYSTLHKLLQNKVLSIQTIENDEGKARDYYSFDSLWERLYQVLVQEKKSVENTKNELSETEIFKRFEHEFSRPLSQIEIEKISAWIDKDNYSLDLIEYALREAVMNQIYNFNYVDRILLNWEKKNITTLQQVQKESEKYKQKKAEKSTDSYKKTNDKPISLYNWLETEE
ncbi:DnaD domain-containing protein [Lacticigenium naphthae]|uniref:DnaD domain-containing protein n=1 Tax=Lacticigenium naphthae TaxID=515351 RepID=UPI0004276BCD|nr:DnaD domain protein [Lacticigenium naphthae]